MTQRDVLDLARIVAGASDYMPPSAASTLAAEMWEHIRRRRPNTAPRVWQAALNAYGYAAADGPARPTADH